MRTPKYNSLSEEDKQKVERLLHEIEAHTPWLWEGSIWNTKPKYFSWLRGALRSIWSKKWVFKNNYLNKNSFPAPKLDANGKEQYFKSGKKKGEVVTRKSFRCEISGEILPIKESNIDHVLPAGKCNDGLEACIFLFRLLTSPDNMRIISKEMHGIVTYAERKGISFEEARIEKTIIAKTKLPVSQQQTELLQAGFTESEVSNSAKRKECYRKLLENK